MNPVTTITHCRFIRLILGYRVGTLGSTIGFLYFLDRSSMIQQIAPAIAVIGQALDSLANSTQFTLEEKRSIGQVALHVNSLPTIRQIAK